MLDYSLDLKELKIFDSYERVDCERLNEYFMKYLKEDLATDGNFIRCISDIDKLWNEHYKNIFMLNLIYEDVVSNGFDHLFFNTDYHIYIKDVIKYVENFLIPVSSEFTDLKEYLEEGLEIANFKKECSDTLKSINDESEAILFFRESYQKKSVLRFGSLNLKFYMKCSKFKYLLDTYLNEIVISFN